MTPPFIITGMPRARTAWVANYLTFGGAHCEHELLGRFDSPADCADWLLSHPDSGMSDSGAVWFQDSLRELLPDARWVIITRPAEESEASFQNEHSMEVPLLVHARHVERACRIPGAMVVRFDEIDQRITDIARFCVPDWIHEEDRHRMLLRFNVQLTHKSLENGACDVLNRGLLRHVETGEQ